MKLKSILGTVAALALTATAATAEIKIGFAAEAYPPFTAKNAAANGKVLKSISKTLFVQRWKKNASLLT